MTIASVMDLLNNWESVGMDYILTFLLIFAVVYGILTATNILGKHKGTHIIIALVMGLMGLRLGMAVAFFGELFPKAAVAIGVILVLVILTSIFVPDSNKQGWLIGYYSVGAIAFLFVVFNSFSTFNWFGSNWWDEWGGLLIGALLIIGVIIAVSVTGGDKSGTSSSGSTTVNLSPFRS